MPLSHCIFLPRHHSKHFKKDTKIAVITSVFSFNISFVSVKEIYRSSLLPNVDRGYVLDGALWTKYEDRDIKGGT
jgi:hypothetical protein